MFPFPETMDDLDLKIVKVLSENCKISFRELAKMLNVSAGTVRNRLIFLEKEGIIVGCNGRFNYKKLGLSEIIVGFDIFPEQYVNTLQRIKELDFVKELYSTSGDHSAIAVVICNENEIYDYIRKMEKIEGVRKVYPAIVNSVIK